MCTVNILKEHQNSKSTIHAINMNYMYIPGGDVECLIGNGIMGQIGRTGQWGLLFHFV